MDATRAKNIFSQWKADLTKKPHEEKRSEFVLSNLEDFFYRLHQATISREIAEEYIPTVAEAHFPPHNIVASTWNRVKVTTPGMNQKEWIEDWKNTLLDKANAAFHTFYSEEDAEDDDEPYDPNIYNGMSKKEHALQQIYVSQFKVVTREEIDAMVKRQKDFEEEEKRFLEESGLTIEDLFFGDKKDGTPKC